MASLIGMISNLGSARKGVTSLVDMVYHLNANNTAGHGFNQIRTKYADWRMIRDVKRRKLVAEHAPERLRINSIRKNDILPIELREVASKEIAENFPRDSCYVRIRHRCALTSRPRGVVHRWRLSRIVWRHLADYNKLSGVQRAMW